MRDNKAQMMVLESILFAITVVVALAFLVQLSPSSIESGTQSTNDLKLLGDDALDSIYETTMHVRFPTQAQLDTWETANGKYDTNNPTSKLAVCIITNNYADMQSSLNEILPGPFCIIFILAMV